MEFTDISKIFYKKSDKSVADVDLFFIGIQKTGVKTGKYPF